MNNESLSNLMFWVGAMFVFTPIAIVAVVILTMRHLRKKQEKAEPQATP